VVKARALGARSKEQGFEPLCCQYLLMAFQKTKNTTSMSDNGPNSDFLLNNLWLFWEFAGNSACFRHFFFLLNTHDKKQKREKMKKDDAFGVIIGRQPV
jgi:hypothetical protein